jgi:sensor domain CHASE-containing protein
MGWRDTYQRGQAVEVLFAGNWLPGFVSRKTTNGSPVVLTRTTQPLALAIDRKADIRHVEPERERKAEASR